MSTSDWSRGDKLAVVGLAIAVAGSFFSTEVRRWIGLESRPNAAPPPSLTSASTAPEPPATQVFQDTQKQPSDKPGLTNLPVFKPRTGTPPPRVTSPPRDEITRTGGAKNLPDIVAAADDALNALRAQSYEVRAQLRGEQSAPDAALEGLITTDLVLDVTLLDGNGSVKETFTIASRGGGFSTHASAFQARTRLIAELRRRTLKEPS